MVCGECRKDSGKDVNKPDIFGEPWNESPWTNFPKEYFTESPKGGMSRVVIFPLYFWKVLHFKPFKGEVPFKLGLGTVCVTTWIISSLILLFPHVQNHPCGQTSPKKKKKRKKKISYQKLLICQLYIIRGSFHMALQTFETAWYICLPVTTFTDALSGMCKVPGLMLLA